MQMKTMKAILTTRAAALGLVIVGLMLSLTTTASAVAPTELLRVDQPQSFQGACCFSWQEKVSVNEPATVVPVIVDWSTDYQSNGYFFTGLSLNGGVCQFYGALVLVPTPNFENFFDSQTMHWVIEPGDGLLPGKNTFTLCGGSIISDTVVITLGSNTLSVRLSK
jgi:hypothetical protein